jgi:hypothetical protein
MTKQVFNHEIDMWGYWCENWCRACITDTEKCPHCDTVHGVGQRHDSADCEKVFQAERDRQLKLFDF